MTLSELKNSILDNSIDLNFMIFVCPGSTFIAEQYITTICKSKLLDIHYLQALANLDSNSFLAETVAENVLNILRVTSFEEDLEDYDQYTNCIVLCKNVNKKLAEKLDQYIITFPEPEAWQIASYIKTVCPSLDETEATWLMNAANKNLHRIANEADKISLFKGDDQKAVLSYLRFDPDTDLYDSSVLKLSEYIITQNSTEIADFLRHKASSFIEPVSLISTLVSQIRTILMVNHMGLSAEDCPSISNKYYYFIKYNRKQPLTYLVNVLHFLTDLDCKIKKGAIEMPKQALTDYIICRVASLA